MTVSSTRAATIVCIPSVTGELFDAAVERGNVNAGGVLMAVRDDQKKVYLTAGIALAALVGLKYCDRRPVKIGLGVVTLLSTKFTYDGVKRLHFYYELIKRFPVNFIEGD